MLTSLKKILGLNHSRKPVRRRPTSTVLAVESLEDRWVPSRVVGGDGQVFGLAHDNALWVYNQGTGAWKNTGGYGVDIAVGNIGD